MINTQPTWGKCSPGSETRLEWSLSTDAFMSEMIIVCERRHLQMSKLILAQIGGWYLFLLSVILKCEALINELIKYDKTNSFLLLLPLHRNNDLSRCDGARGLSSRGGGAAAEQLTLEDIAKNIRERQHQRVVVMAGAGISTPSGIPDFRSKVLMCVLLLSHVVSLRIYCENPACSRSLAGLQAAVSMTTCSSTTCPTRRPYSSLASSTKTLIPSSPWPKSCIQETTSPTWPTTLSACFRRRGSSSGCTRRTLTDWKDVCICESTAHRWFCLRAPGL